MDLQKLKENIVAVKIEYRGFEVNIDIAPDADEVEDDTNAGFVARKVKKWDIEAGGKTIPISEKTMKEIPPGLFTAILDKIFEVRDSELGKLKYLGRSPSESEA